VAALRLEARQQRRIDGEHGEPVRAVDADRDAFELGRDVLCGDAVHREHLDDVEERRLGDQPRAGTRARLRRYRGYRDRRCAVPDFAGACRCSASLSRGQRQRSVAAAVERSSVVPVLALASSTP